MLEVMGIYPEIKDEESRPDLQSVGILERFLIMVRISVVRNRKVSSRLQRMVYMNGCRIGVVGARRRK